MGSKTRLIVLLAVLLALTLMVGVASAGTNTDPATGITLVYPESREDCNAVSDTVTVNGLSPEHRVIFVVFKDESGTWVQVARSEPLAPSAGSVSFTFDYPAWSESIYMYVSAEVYDASTSPWSQVVVPGMPGKWAISCPPPVDACTPGYWRQEQHYDQWAVAGYDPGDDFDSTFGTDYFDPDITLGEAAWLGGGGVRKVARFGVASLLSAAHPGVDFSLSEGEVIALVQAEDGNALGDLFPEDGYVCPLN